MTPVQPEELSAFLDGELGPGRAAEVQSQIAEDPGLRATFESLRALDDHWRAAAHTLPFVPRLRPAMPATSHGWALVLAAAIALALVRVAVRMIDATAIAFAFQLLVLAAILAWFAWQGRSELRAG